MTLTAYWPMSKNAGRRLPVRSKPSIKKGLPAMPKPSIRREEILAVFAKYDGQLSIPRLARYCWEEGVWSPEEQLRMGFRDAKRQCQEVLSTKNSLGLPVAGPSP